MKVIALCHTCQHQHAIDFDPMLGPGSAFGDWITKHPQDHLTEFHWPQRTQKAVEPDGGWLHYLHNADVKTAYASSAAVTITLASLAASSTLLVGRESTAVSNASNKYLDFLLAGFYEMAASNNQAGSIVTAVVGALDDTPTWPSVFDGTDSAETVPDQPTFDSVCRVVSHIANDNTASQVWPWGPTAIASLFGGVVPVQWVVFVTQSAHTGTNAWGATEGNHGIKQTGIYATVA